MNLRPLLIRADANAAIGSGHVMRCLALAQAWQDSGGEAIFAAAEIPDAIRQRLTGERFEVLGCQAYGDSGDDASALANLASQRRPAWVVLDGERFTTQHVDILKEHGQPVLMLDDFGSSHAERADLILNQNLGISREAYAWCPDGARLLLGTQYLLLRREFLRTKQRTSVRTTPQWLISFGGSDPDGLTERVLAAIGGKLDVEVTAVIGSGNPRLSYFRELAQHPGVKILLDPPNVPQLMMESDLAVIAAGGTLWEALYCGCAVLSYFRNSLQRKVISALAERGVVRDLGIVADFDPEALLSAIRELAASQGLRDQMRMAGQAIADGGGARRVVERLLEADCIRK